MWRIAKLRRLLGYWLAEFETHGARNIDCVLRRFARQERFDTVEVAELEVHDVLRGLRAVIGIDGVDLYPQAVIPVRASGLREPRAHGDEEQDEQQ